MNWKFLDTFNTTGFKGWSAGWLWVYTGLIWGVAVLISAVKGTDLPADWLWAWMAGLAGYSGVSAFQYKAMRDTDWKALEIKTGKVGDDGV